MAPIIYKNTPAEDTALYAAKLILFHILDLKYEIHGMSRTHIGGGLVFVVDFGVDICIKIFLVKREEHSRRNSELDDRWYPAFAQIEMGIEERLFILHFAPTDINAYDAPPKIIGYSEVPINQSDKVLSWRRMHNIEPNRHDRPKVNI
ncbi:MAG: hypothetical protein ABIJ72_01250 [bacterium]